MTGEEVRILGVSEFQRNEYFDDVESLPTVHISEKLTDRDVLQENDLLFVRSNGNKALIGRCLHIGRMQAVASFSGFTIRGRRTSKSVDSIFGGRLFRGPKFRRYLDEMGGGTNISNLSQAILSDFTVALPTLPEQQKIASFLGAVDGKISGLRRKEAALTRFKAGLMQKLFSQKIRFTREDGSAFPDWEEKRLGAVFVERAQRGDILAELLSVTMNKGVVRAAEIDRTDGASADLSNYKSVRAGDIAYNSMRMWQGASGVSKYNGIVSPAYTVIYATSPQVMDFWGYYFKLPSVIFLFERSSQGLTSDTWNLKYPALASIRLAVPCIDEQRKIADAILAIDDKIAAVRSQTSRMEAFKKGLLQQMFV
ncbi:restriction endonuclease subunit S [Paragemmobacter straminiformis]|nr:restriction endonuclease subunit S [Gemmobacter straminiformis]